MRAEQMVNEIDRESSVTARAEAVVDSLPGRAEVAEMDRRVRSFVSEKPLVAVCLALATGYVVGRVLSRLS